MNETSLALVGTLLTITLETTNNENEGSVEASAVAASSGPGAAGQSLYGRSHLGQRSSRWATRSRRIAANSPFGSSWARYVTGVDQAIERVRNEADARLLQEQQPPKAEEPPGTSLLEEDDGAGKKDAAAFVEEAALEAGRRKRAERDLIDAIDLTIAAWKHESPAALRSLLSTSTGPAIARSSTPRASARGTRQSPADGRASR